MSPAMPATMSVSPTACTRMAPMSGRWCSWRAVRSISNTALSVIVENTRAPSAVAESDMTETDGIGCPESLTMSYSSVGRLPVGSTTCTRPPVMPASTSPDGAWNCTVRISPSASENRSMLATHASMCRASQPRCSAATRGSSTIASAGCCPAIDAAAARTLARAACFSARSAASVAAMPSTIEATVPARMAIIATTVMPVAMRLRRIAETSVRPRVCGSASTGSCASQRRNSSPSSDAVP